MEKTRKPDFKLISWTTRQDATYYTAEESISLNSLIPTYLSITEETQLSNTAMQTFPPSKKMEPVKPPPRGLHVVISIASCLYSLIAQICFMCLWRMSAHIYESQRLLLREQCTDMCKAEVPKTVILSPTLTLQEKEAGNQANIQWY